MQKQSIFIKNITSVIINIKNYVIIKPKVKIRRLRNKKEKIVESINLQSFYL